MEKEISVSKKNGFTLAETLITTGIIGVIAAIMFNIITPSIKDSTATSRLKKTYSSLQQALLQAVAENGEVENWGISMEPVIRRCNNIPSD